MIDYHISIIFIIKNRDSRYEIKNLNSKKYTNLNLSLQILCMKYEVRDCFSIRENRNVRTIVLLYYVDNHHNLSYKKSKIIKDLLFGCFSYSLLANSCKVFVWKPTAKNDTNPKEGNPLNEVGSVLVELVDSGGHIEYMVMTSNCIRLNYITLYYIFKFEHD